MHPLVRLLLPALFVSLAAGPARAVTYHVAPGGSNAADGLTPATAFATIQHAANRTQPGDIVLVADGDHAGFNITRSGQAGAPVTYRGTGPDVRITTPNTFTTRDGINIEGANWIVIEGFIASGHARAGIRAVLGSHIVIRGNTCRDNGRWGIFTGFTDDLTVEHNTCSGSIEEHGIYVSNSSDRALIRGNRVHHNRASGIQINADATLGGDGISSDCRIENNLIWENGIGGGAAINLDGAVNCTITNNVLYENHATGIALFRIDAATSSRGARIQHNTIVQAADARWNVLIVDGATDVTLRNNILVTQHTFRGVIAVDAASLSGLSSNHNMVSDRFSTNAGSSGVSLAAWRTATGQDQDSRLAGPLDALFAGRAGGDFRLAPASLALDAGTTLDHPLAAHDALGVGRPQGTAPDAGAYERVVTAPPAATARFLNLSTRARTTPDDPVIAGFVIVGSGERSILIRVCGPALRTHGVPTAHEDPRLRLFAGSTLAAENDDWGLAPELAEIERVTAEVGAFPFEAGSADAAVLRSLPPGAYSVHGVAPVGSGSGPILIELYDAGGSPGSNARLANVSTRALSGTGDDTVIAGFVLEGAATSVLVRAVGPGLADFGVTNALADPQLVLFDFDAPILDNDQWSLGADPSAVAVLAAQLGAFPLRPGSADAALRATLQPRMHAVHASPARPGAGTLLIEVYAP